MGKTNEQVVQEVATWLGSLGYARKGPTDGADLVVTAADGSEFVVEVKPLAEMRQEDLQGRLAMAVLQLRKRCEGLRAVPLVVVALPHWSERAEDATARFMADWAPEVGWGIVTGDGGRVLALPGKGRTARTEPDEGARSAAKSRDTVNLFTDANRWMLKILLLDGARADLWGGPRQAVKNAADLARLARVSPEAAYRLVKTLESENLAVSSRNALRLVRREQVVGRWLEHDRYVRPDLWHARWIYGNPSKPTDVFGKPTHLRHALAGFSACEALGVLHTTPPRVMDMHVTGGLAEVLRTWSLEQVDARDADLVLRPTKMTRSVFGGCVERDGVQVVDALQAALDVVSSPARGTEQAEYIVRHVLQLGGES